MLAKVDQRGTLKRDACRSFEQDMIDGRGHSVVLSIITAGRVYLPPIRQWR